MCSDVTLMQKNKRSVDISFVKEKKNSSLHGQMGRLVLWSSCEEGMHIEVSILISKNSNYTRWNILIRYAWKKTTRVSVPLRLCTHQMYLYRAWRKPEAETCGYITLRVSTCWVCFPLEAVSPGRSLKALLSCRSASLKADRNSQWDWSLVKKTLFEKCQCELWGIVTDIFILD